jgi:hypothetical protein
MERHSLPWPKPAPLIPAASRLMVQASATAASVPMPALRVLDTSQPVHSAARVRPPLDTHRLRLAILPPLRAWPSPVLASVVPRHPVRPTTRRRQCILRRLRPLADPQPHHRTRPHRRHTPQLLPVTLRLRRRLVVRPLLRAIHQLRHRTHRPHRRSRAPRLHTTALPLRHTLQRRRFTARRVRLMAERLVPPRPLQSTRRLLPASAQRVRSIAQRVRLRTTRRTHQPRQGSLRVHRRRARLSSIRRRPRRSHHSR